MMMKPMIHLNGTARATLADDYEAAGHALHEALRKLEAAAPHGRDYYPQGPDALARAQAEHRARVAAVKKAYDEIAELYEYVATKED